MPRAPKYPCIACGRGTRRANRCRSCGALQRLDGYEVLVVLGHSARGRVYRARGAAGEVILKELVFATVPDAAAVERFESEAALLRRLNYPRIPKCLEVRTAGKGTALRHFLVLQSFAGEDLERRLTHHTFDEAECHGIAEDALGLLEYLHTRSPRLIHRRVEPSNLVMLDDGRIGLVGFGDVHTEGTGPESPNGSAMREHSFGFAPPEQLPHQANPRTDLFALGMALCRLLSRKAPEELFCAATLAVRFRKFVQVSEPFARFLERLVARDPSQGFTTAADARTALSGLNSAPAPRTTSPEMKSNPIDPAPARPQRQSMPLLPPPLPRRFRPGPAYRGEHHGRTDRGNPPSPAVGDPSHPFRSPAAALAQARRPHEVDWLIAIGSQRIRLGHGAEIIVGRSDGDALELRGGRLAVENDRMNANLLRPGPSPTDCATVSRRHLRIRVRSAGLELEDLGSTNGTVVNGRVLQAHQRLILRDGAHLRLGRSWCVVQPAFEALDAAPPSLSDPVLRRLGSG